MVVPRPGSTADPDAGPQPYHRLLRNPVTAGWTVVLGAFAILAGWMFVSLVVQTVRIGVRPDPEGTISWFGLLATNLTLIVLIPLTMLVATRLNRQAPGLLSSVTGRLRWRLLAGYAGIAVALELVMLTVIKVGGIELVGRDGGIAADAAAVIAVTLLTSSLQAAGEEYFFRGYLLQAVGAFVRGPLVAILVTTVLFTMAHGVWPWESPALFLDRFAFGLVAGFLAVRTGGLEAPIAAHAANNVVTFVYAALTDSVNASLNAGDAGWGLVAVDVTKFVLFGVLVLVVARRTKAATTCGLPLVVAPTAGGPGRRLI